MVLADDPLLSRYPGAELLLRIAGWGAFWKLPALCADHTVRHGFGPCSAGWDLTVPPRSGRPGQSGAKCCPPPNLRAWLNPIPAPPDCMVFCLSGCLQKIILSFEETWQIESMAVLEIVA